MLETGNAAMLLSFDISADAIVEHDDWHTHEHLPERLAIPGFLHGSRWISRCRAPRYFVIYDVKSLAVLASEDYLQRLNNPTPWTAKMMRSYIGMRRALCDVEARFGAGQGTTALLIRFAPIEDGESALLGWLKKEMLPEVSRRPGIASSHLFVTSLAAPMTREQQIRGKDVSLLYAALVTGYDAGRLTTLAEQELSGDRFVAQGGSRFDYALGIYQLGFSMAAKDIRADS